MSADDVLERNTCKRCGRLFRDIPPSPSCECPDNPLAFIEAKEKAAVDRLGSAIGYGRMMQFAEECWRELLERSGGAGGEHTTGPCAAFMVPCECIELGTGPVNCDWCCGCGRVTKHVREVQRNLRRDQEDRRAR